LKISLAGGLYAVPLIVALVLSTAAPAVEHTFRLETEGAQSVAVAGEFNDWNPHPMDQVAENAWQCSLELEPGEYGYKFVIDGDRWLMDPANEVTKVVDGVENSSVALQAPEPSPDTDCRTWTAAASGRTLEATLVGVESGKATLKSADGVEFRIAVSALAEEDRDLVASWLRARTEEPAPVKPSQEAPKPAGPFRDDLPTGEKLTFTIPMKTPLRFDGSRYKPKDDPQGMVEFGLALPKDFDPQRSDYFIAVISQTVDGDASSVGHMNAYYQAALRRGWICLAADRAGGEEARKAWSPITRRWMVLAQVLEEMHQAWPQSEKWKYATMGFSGGAGYANYLGARLAAERYKLVGIWQGGSAYTDRHFPATLTPSRRFYRARYAMSWGRHDTVCSRDLMMYAYRWAQPRFRDFMYEEYDGGHEPYEPHIENALAWFMK